MLPATRCLYRFSLSSTVVAITFAVLAYASSAAAALNPPPAYVIAADGVTHQTLEEAGILNTADGRKYGIVLGKALFWDMQAGSDGMACASCHFHAGADARLRNQLNPGFRDVSKNNGAGDTAFGSERSDTGSVNPGNLPSNHVAAPNYRLTPRRICLCINSSSRQIGTRVSSPRPMIVFPP